MISVRKFLFHYFFPVSLYTPFFGGGRGEEGAFLEFHFLSPF